MTLPAVLRLQQQRKGFSPGFFANKLLKADFFLLGEKSFVKL
jgi:hypothetical protein